jgi:hypothetical protein
MQIQDIENYKPKTALEVQTKEIILENIYESYVEDFFVDLMKNGCACGMIGSLIYYSDTKKIFNDNREEINTMLSKTLNEAGLCVSELFGDKFDTEDFLFTEETNQNFLAWFAFEETARNITNQLRNGVLTWNF